MNNNLGHSVLTSKSNNDMLAGQNITRSVRAGQKYLNPKDQKVSLELQYMRLQQQYRRQIAAWSDQVNDLKMQLDLEQQKLHQLETRQIHHKQQLNTMHKENLKLFQENEKQKKLISTLKSDNQALELQIERWKSDRKTYSSKLDSIYELKKNINIELSQKNSLIEEQQFKLRENEKKLNDYKLKVQELAAALTQKQRETKQISGEVRNHLQSFLEAQNLVSKLQHELQETNQLHLSLKQKIIQLEREKQVLIQRIHSLGGDKSDRSHSNNQNQDHEDNQYFNPHSKSTKRPKNQSPELQHIISPTDERLMLEIQSFMREFESLLDRKAEQRNTALEQLQKVVNAVECLEKNT